MRVVNVRDCRFEVSQSSSVRVRVDRAVDLVERRVVRWAIGLQCVLANAVPCTRPGKELPALVPWELAPDFRRPEQLVPAAGPVGLHAGPANAMFRVE